MPWDLKKNYICTIASAFQQLVLPPKGKSLLCYMNDTIPLPNCLDLSTLSLHSSEGNRMTDLDICRNFDCKLNIIKTVFWKGLLNCIDTFLTYSCHSLVTCCLILLVEESYIGKQHILLQWWEASSSPVSLPCVDIILNILWYPEAYIFFCIFENKPLAYVVTKFMQKAPQQEFATCHLFSELTIFEIPNLHQASLMSEFIVQKQNLEN